MHDPMPNAMTPNWRLGWKNWMTTFDTIFAGFERIKDEYLKYLYFQ